MRMGKEIVISRVGGGGSKRLPRGRGEARVEIQWLSNDMSMVVIYQTVWAVWFSKPDLYESDW